MAIKWQKYLRVMAMMLINGLAAQALCNPVHLVGLPDLMNLARTWRRMRPVVVGPKGDGKSCRLRAFVSLLCTAAPALETLRSAEKCKPDVQDRLQAHKSLMHVISGYKEQLHKFMQHASVLGAVVADDPYRRQLVEFYAAKHPLSLDILDRACIQIATKKLLGAQQVDLDVGPDGRWSWPPELPDLTPKEVGELLDSYEDWDSVISAFQIYVEEFRSKEEDAGGDHGPWVAYARMASRGAPLNGSEAGWLCEGLCNDVISRRGLTIDPSGLSLNVLSLTTFSTIPGDVATGMLRKGTGFMFWPIQYNYGRVDAVVFYRDTAGKLHIIGLQYTTCLEDHLHSGSEFMSIRELEKWYGSDILEATQKSQELCLFNDAASSSAGGCQAAARWKPRGHSAAQTPCYLFRSCTGRQGEKQQWCLPAALEPVLLAAHGSTIELSSSRFKKLTRYEANALALNAGIDPNAYTRNNILAGLKAILIRESPGPGIHVLRGNSYKWHQAIEILFSSKNCEDDEVEIALAQFRVVLKCNSPQGKSHSREWTCNIYNARGGGGRDSTSRSSSLLPKKLDTQLYARTYLNS
ncbi:hypothetical protein SELMODRAFT_426356 [Selaginella moellendorffii]|uniref:Uncharacterized protein n=1 Tax=Selaginella moellendorffii TaxID=88036 RepID=D8SW44_SELML|nr:hypothetical protein SELMODRAFT_426356 [Selaginella moellendorffii]